MNNDNERQLAARVSPEMQRAFADFATYHGRSISEELRVAIDVHIACATLAYLGRPEALEELGSPEQVKEATKRVKADMERLSSDAYRPRPITAPAISLN
jgi:predicted DNA-binding protein